MDVQEIVKGLYGSLTGLKIYDDNLLKATVVEKLRDIAGSDLADHFQHLLDLPFGVMLVWSTPAHCDFPDARDIAWARYLTYLFDDDPEYNWFRVMAEGDLENSFAVHVKALECAIASLLEVQA